MQQVSTRLLEAGDFSLLLHDILDAAVAITGAQMGHIQLLDGDCLRIAAQRGFETPFLEYFDSVDGERAACGTALQRGERVIVEDVRNSPIFRDTGLECCLRRAGGSVGAALSRSDGSWGVLTHYQHAPQQPTDRALPADILARQAADLIEHKQSEESGALLAEIVSSSDVPS
jgi:GAF domain-containing protein